MAHHSSTLLARLHLAWDFLRSPVGQGVCVVTRVLEPPDLEAPCTVSMLEQCFPGAEA
jgi:hypothetical protein